MCGKVRKHLRVFEAPFRSDRATHGLGKARTSYDNAGRTTCTIQNYVAIAGCGSAADDVTPGEDQNVVTQMTYNADGAILTLTAKNPATGDQTTTYVYGTTLADSDLASNDLLRAEIYPDTEDGADAVSYTYNRQGQVTSKTDQNGSVHEYAFDLLARPTSDAVTTLGTDVDDAVLRIDQSYEVRGMVESITSYDAASGGSVVNEVQNVYNDFAQLATQYQEHNGAVNTGTTLKVEYGYADGSDNTIRPTSLTYPDGRVLDYRYDDEAADELSRIRTLRWDGTDVCRYGYLGLYAYVQVEYLEPAVLYNLATGSGMDPYAGLDRFGRIVDLLWEPTASPSGSSSSSSSSSSSGGPSGLAHLTYGYDRAGDRTYRADLVAASYSKDFDELYEYDGLHRLKKFHRGRLVESDSVISDPTLQQSWSLDATGNWRNFTQSDQSDASQALDQQRLHNRVNEITQIARTVGSDWATPSYDRNGNMTEVPQPSDMTGTYQAVWDAWDRLVKLSDGADTVQENAYDGLRRRVVRLDYTGGTLDETRHFYYTDQWQAVEERLESGGVISPNPNRQYVWGERYIDDLVLRDRDTTGDGTLDERLYALQDANWNIVAVIDTTGDVQERYAYQAYGVPLFLAPDYTTRTVSSFAWKTLFAGYHWDDQVKFYLVRNRWLQCLLGRWISRDLDILSWIKLYAYASNRPNSFVDPFGLCDCNITKVTIVLNKKEKESFEGVTFTNPKGVPAKGAADLNNPGPFQDLNAGRDKAHGKFNYVVWVVFEGTNLDSCVFRRYKVLDVKGIDPRLIENGKFTSGYGDGKKISSTGAVDKDGPQRWEEYTSRDKTIVAIADAPGVNPVSSINGIPSGTEFSLKWNFLVEAKAGGAVVAQAWYDVVIDGTFIEHKFRNTRVGGPGTIKAQNPETKIP